MIPRLFIAGINRGEQTWGKGVCRPPEFDAGGPLHEKAIVYSPFHPSQCALKLALRELSLPQGTQLTMYVVSSRSEPPNIVDPRTSALVDDSGTLLIPISGEFANCRNGFLLVDRNRAPIVAFQPPFSSMHHFAWPGSPDSWKYWPDWRVALNLRQLALVRTIAPPDTGIDKARENRWPEVVLEDLPYEEAPKDKIGWANPLAVGYREDAGVGDADESMKPTNTSGSDICRAISEAIDNGSWWLIPMLSKDAVRRLVGWNAVWGRLSDRSLLASLFTKGNAMATENSHFAGMADLAGLDSLKGCFEAVHEHGRPIGRWLWHLPAETDLGAMQLARHLTKNLELTICAPLAEESRVLHWRRRHRWPRGKLFLVEGASGEQKVVDHLAAVSSMISSKADLGPDGPTLKKLILPLKDEAKRFDRHVGDCVFTNGILEPLLNVMFNDRPVGSDGNHLYNGGTISILARFFFTPESRVLVRMTALRTKNMDCKKFDERWNAWRMDLFQSPGGGPAETLRAAIEHLPWPGEEERKTEREGVYRETREERGAWWSSFWRYCVVGKRDVSFVLWRREQIFRLDRSTLDGGARLG